MNFFLLLKNELSMYFLRKEDNVMQTLKSAIHIEAHERNAKRWANIEEEELQMLAKTLQIEEEENHQNPTAPEEETKEGFVPQGLNERNVRFDRIVHKLLDFNEKINSGREISVVEYLKRIDMNSDFMHQYENQRHLKRAFFEEFKIHSFNYILLLFESVTRVLTTLESRNVVKEEKAGDGNDPSQHYFSKNYRRFLEHR